MRVATIYRSTSITGAGFNKIMIDPLTLNGTTKNWGEINPGAQRDAGTFNRFSYFLAYNYFVLINDPNKNVRLLKKE